MADTKPKTVTVEALEVHTYDGKSYDVGDTYDLDEQYVDSVAYQGKAIRVDRVAEATKAAKAAKSKPVAPMTTTSTRALAKPRKAKK